MNYADKSYGNKQGRRFPIWKHLDAPSKTFLYYALCIELTFIICYNFFEMAVIKAVCLIKGAEIVMDINSRKANEFFSKPESVIKVTNIIKIVYIVCLILAILICIVSISLPSNSEEERAIKYVPYTSELKVGKDCTVKLNEDEIVATIKTVSSLRSNGSSFLDVTVNYHLIKKSDGSMFYVKTNDESNTNLTKLVKSNAIYEGDFRDAFSYAVLHEGSGAGVKFYGKTESPPSLSADEIKDLLNDSDSSVETEIANKLLREHPIVCICSTEPQTETVVTGDGIGRIMLYFAPPLFIIGFVLLILRYIILRKFVSENSSEYIN